jgi:3-isopropylmalate dehydrogenase
MTMKTFKIALLPGDGIGPEVVAAAREVLESVGDRYDHRFVFDAHPIGGAGIDAAGEPLPAKTLQACIESDAILLGAVGGPKWDKAPKRPEMGLLELRKALGLFANVRPVMVHPTLADKTPLKEETVAGVDLVVFRELTGGVYYGEKKRDAASASDLCVYTATEIERIARAAFDAARRRRHKVTSVDKANVMETSRLWRETVTRVHNETYRDIELEHQLVDSMTMHLIRHPREYDVILTENMFGDILSDEASVLAGSLGLSPSASLGAAAPGLFEPVHGSAPALTGQDVANPIGAILSVALLLRYGLRLHDEAASVENAVSRTLDDGHLTRDLGGDLGCRAMGDIIAAHVGAARGFAAHRLQMQWG